MSIVDDLLSSFSSYSTSTTEKGSFVPFSLRVISAELPAFLSDSKTAIDRLFALLVGVV